jgi:hypothetical protein
MLRAFWIGGFTRRDPQVEAFTFHTSKRPAGLAGIPIELQRPPGATGRGSPDEFRCRNK